MERKDDAYCHCDDHGEIKSACKQVDAIEKKMDKFVPRSAFQWTIGIMILVLIGILGFIQVGLTSIQRDVTSIDKGVAVLKVQMSIVEKRNDKIDSSRTSENYGSTLNRN